MPAVNAQESSASIDSNKNSLTSWIEETQAQLEQDGRARPWKKTFGEAVHDPVGSDEFVTVTEESKGQICTAEGNVAA